MNQENAKKIIYATDEAINKLSVLLEIINSSLSKDDDTRHKYQHALAVAITEIDIEILEPIYKQFPDLRPPEMMEVKPE